MGKTVLQNDEQKFEGVPAHLTSNMNHRMLCFWKNKNKNKNTPVQPLVSSHLISYSEKPQYSTKVIKL